MDDVAMIPSRDDCVVGNLLQRWSRERPHQNFLEFEDGASWTYAATLDRVQHAAGGLRSLGVGHGSHVLCWMPNLREAVLAWLAANYLGAVHVPLNTGDRGRLLQHAVALSDARVLVAPASLLPRLAEIETGPLEDIIVVGGNAPAGDGRLRFHTAAVLEHADKAEPTRPVEPWDINLIIFT